jgi:hypothetical protein
MAGQRPGRAASLAHLALAQKRQLLAERVLKLGGRLGTKELFRPQDG